MSVNKLADSFTANLERRAERAREWNDSLSVRTPPVIQRWLWAVKAATRQWPTAGTADQSHDTYQARVAAFETQWRQDTGRKQPSLAGALSDTFPGFWYVAIWRMLSDGMLVVQPLVVQQLIRFNQASEYLLLSCPDKRLTFDTGHEAHENHTAAPSVGRGIGLAIGLFCLLQFSSVCLEQYNFRAKQYGVLARGAMVQALYERVFRLSIPARASNSDGKLTTHLSADITRVDSAVHLFHAAWTSAIRLGVVLILLCLQIGPSGLVGFLVFLFLAPVQTMILKFGLRMRGKSMVFTELRSNLLQQVLGSMSIVKMFTYEVPYLKRLTGLRAGELAGIRFLHLTRSGAESFALSLPTMASVVAFVMYTSVQPAFDPAVIFPAIMYFNSFQGSLMIIPRSLSMTMDAYNALKRLAPVFNAEVKDDGLTIVSTLDVAIRTAQASFRWVSGPPDQPISAGGGGSNGENDASTHNSGFTLADINMEIPRGRLVAVVGPVGSGKSSLMLGLLGEMTRIAGIVQFSSRPAYCAQSAWIQNATVRDNVVFGQPFDETRYWSCIKDACLIPDLEILADGDMTEVSCYFTEVY